MKTSVEQTISRAQFRLTTEMAVSASHKLKEFMNLNDS